MFPALDCFQFGAAGSGSSFQEVARVTISKLSCARLEDTHLMAVRSSRSLGCWAEREAPMSLSQARRKSSAVSQTPSSSSSDF